MLEMGWLLRRREALKLALVKIVAWAFLYLQERLFQPTPSQDMWFLQQTELGWAVHTVHPQKQGLPFQWSSTQKKCCKSLSFSKGTHVNSCWDSIYFLQKSAVLGACICKPLSYLVTRETAQDAEPVLLPGLHCQGQPKENCGTTSSNTWYFNQGGHVGPQYWKL